MALLVPHTGRFPCHRVALSAWAHLAWPLFGPEKHQRGPVSLTVRRSVARGCHAPWQTATQP